MQFRLSVIHTREVVQGVEVTSVMWAADVTRTAKAMLFRRAVDALRAVELTSLLQGEEFTILVRPIIEFIHIKEGARAMVYRADTELSVEGALPLLSVLLCAAGPLLEEAEL